MFLSAGINNASMAIYDVNRTELDSLIIGDVVTVVIDAGEYVTKELKIKRCAVVGDNSELPIIENFEVWNYSTAFNVNQI